MVSNFSYAELLNSDSGHIRTRLPPGTVTFNSRKRTLPISERDCRSRRHLQAIVWVLDLVVSDWRVPRLDGTLSSQSLHCGITALSRVTILYDLVTCFISLQPALGKIAATPISGARLGIKFSSTPFLRRGTSRPHTCKERFVLRVSDSLVSGTNGKKKPVLGSRQARVGQD